MTNKAKMKTICNHNGINVLDGRDSHDLAGVSLGDVIISQTLDGELYGSRVVLDGSTSNDLGLRGIDYDYPALFAAEAAAERLIAVEAVQ